MFFSSKVLKHMHSSMELFYILPLLVFVNSSCLITNNPSWLQDGLNHIFFRFYLGKNIKQYIDVSNNDTDKLVSKMDIRKPTIIYLHGYLCNVESNDVITVVSGYLERDDHNVLAVDYRKISNKNYTELVYSAGLIGKKISAGINKLVDHNVPKNSIHIVGHSMGAQVAAYVGRSTSFKVSRITGLDPAGPHFNYPEEHLTNNDATFVDTIYTDGGAYGTARMSGTVMFFVNNGIRIQPGCPINYENIEDDFCSHHRSWKYYAESLKKENAFIATYCTSAQMFTCGNCNHNKKISMGYATPNNVKGTFYLKTRSQSPFGLGIEETISDLKAD